MKTVPNMLRLARLSIGAGFTLVLTAGVDLEESAGAEPSGAPKAQFTAVAADRSNTATTLTQQTRILPIQIAFSKGLAVVGDHVDIFDPRGWITLRRTHTNCWSMTLHKYHRQDTNGIHITIADDATVKVLDPLGTTETTTDSRAPSAPVAFRKAIRSLKNRVDLLDPEGDIMFTRTKQKEWFVRLMGYKGLPFQGLMLRIRDDLRIEESSAP